MGSARYIEKLNQESVQAHINVSNKRFRGREYCTLMSFYISLYYSVGFVLKEMRSYAECPYFSSLLTLLFPICNHVFSSTVATLISSCCCVSSPSKEEECTPTIDNFIFFLYFLPSLPTSLSEHNDILQCCFSCLLLAAFLCFTFKILLLWHYEHDHTFSSQQESRQTECFHICYVKLGGYEIRI